MATTSPPDERIVTLDIVRGIAVMGILAMNIVDFGWPPNVYVNPIAAGSVGNADIGSWLFNFVFFDGKMRGLFSFLFGASILLVIDRAAASGQSPARVHYSRMFWLLVLGLLHYFLIWHGDILALYAPVGMVAFLYRRAKVEKLVASGIILLAVQFALFAAITIADPPELAQSVGVLDPQRLQEALALHRGPYLDLVTATLGQWQGPITSVVFFGWETLGYMLFGMAALRSGFLTGGWRPGSYRKLAMIGFGIGVPIYLVLAWLEMRSGFDPKVVAGLSEVATVPIRPLMIVAIAALVILLTRRGGALVDRIAAAGRAAFSNYLGTSILMTFIFYGWGMGYFGKLPRIELWIPVLAAWALMLIWSKPWLDHFRYGPFEWLWRSLARGRPQPMRRLPPEQSAEALA
jgi:uncharacterized protein